MKKVLLGALCTFAMVGCGIQSTPETTINTNAAPDIHNIVAEHALKPLATAGSNLLTNGDFENGITAWTGCDVGVANTSSDAQAGSGAISIDNNCFFQSVNIEVGKSYTLSCQIKETVDSGWTGMGFNFTNIDWAIVNEEVSTEALSNGYTLYSISRQAPATATYGTMWVFSSGSAIVDNCSIVEGITPVEPTPVTPVEPTPVEPTPVTPVEPTPVTPVTPVEPTPITPVEPTPVTPVTPVEPTPVTPVETTPVAPNSITDIAIGAGLHKLVQALKITNLDAVLAEDAGGPYTVFAPTDAAFDEILATLDLSFEEFTADVELVKQILLYHVILDELSLETLEEAQAVHDTRYETMSFLEDIDFGVFDGILYLDDLSGRKITASATDVMASNGVVHVIDTVLLPPSVQETLLGK